MDPAGFSEPDLSWSIVSLIAFCSSIPTFAMTPHCQGDLEGAQDPGGARRGCLESHKSPADSRSVFMSDNSEAEAGVTDLAKSVCV